MTATSAAPLATGVPAAVGGWLARGLPESVPPFRAERIAGGYSMLTYRVTDVAGHAWVLRHRPAGRHDGGAHDTGREARAMSALHPTAVPVPRVRLVGTAGDPLGLPCHVTDFVDGHVLADADAAATLLDPAALRHASLSVVATLAALHAVDPDEVGLGDLGPRGAYLRRQLHRWRSVIARSSAGEAAPRAARLEAMAARLERRMPRDDRSRVVHGDYRLGNAIVDAGGGIRAVLDWELVTLGEPLADLGLLAAFWDPPAEAMLGVRLATSAPGAASLDEAVAHYAALTGEDLSDFDFHYRMACWRVAGTALRALNRYRSGVMNDDVDTTRFVVACDAWIELAQRPL
ncbi:phosphotransferase family protein [Phytohabitans houttuyneae]|uniref:Acyl-CoA dehydrogenase n=1 Tax=Phytohabitans houttuyneae TaxID=1076126 RepID=A0A6V8KG67_9ACTN|nr:phosphotransferase family protein [Phytohabitans houttuyneae]GFJ82370.1 acyl-CoA dehydrogenase [Phytohabitans houttuyneae]